MKQKTGMIAFYCAAPRPLKTELRHYMAQNKDHRDRVKVVVKLMADEEGVYGGGSQYEIEDDEMRLISWRDDSLRRKHLTHSLDQLEPH